MGVIGIRVNANEKIAMGHLMRCMSIAQQLRKTGQTAIFILSEPYAGQLVAENGFACVCLSRIYEQREMEIKELAALIRQKEITCLLIDAYDLTAGYMREVKRICKTVYIDDLAHFEYPADIIINYTCTMTKPLTKLQKDTTKKYLLGMRYAPLREEFSGDGIWIRKQARQLLITTGGTDFYHMAVGVLEGIRGMAQLKKHVVAGKFCQNIVALQEMARADDSIQVYHDIPDIYQVMKSCDFAVSAGGSTLAELCACGVPTICFAVADNQLPGIRTYVNAGIMQYAGDVRQDREGVIKRVAKSVELLAENPAERKEMGIKGKQFVDGKGAGRIAREIQALDEDHCTASQTLGEENGLDSLVRATECEKPSHGYFLSIQEDSFSGS